MGRFSFVGPSYTVQSNTVADEECINLYAESLETSGAQTKASYFGTPGLAVNSALPESPTRGSCEINGRAFVVAGASLYEVMADGTNSLLFGVSGFGPTSIVASSIELLVVSGGQAWCMELADNSFVEVTSMLAGAPIKAQFSDSYFVVNFFGSNKFQISGILDGTTWPGIQVNEVSVFPENVVSILVSHRELWAFGRRHIQPYQDTGSDEVYDVIPGTLIETGSCSTFSPCLLDNSPFWVEEDERGARQAWRASGYTPQRISTHAVEFALTSYTADQMANLVTYSYQDGGHLFWVLYIPGTDCTWVYDVATGLWHKRSTWNTTTAQYSPHLSWNHMWVFGKHLVGDWNSGNLYEMHLPFDNGGGVYSFVTDNGAVRRWLRRSPTLVEEMQRIYHAELTIDFATGLGPQPPLQDGDGNDRQPQCMLRWSDDRGSTWSNEHVLDCGFSGEYKKRVIQRRLGQSRYRVYEVSGSDPIPWAIVDAYLRTA